MRPEGILEFAKDDRNPKIVQILLDCTDPHAPAGSRAFQTSMENPTRETCRIAAVLH